MDLLTVALAEHYDADFDHIAAVTRRAAKPPRRRAAKPPSRQAAKSIQLHDTRS